MKTRPRIILSVIVFLLLGLICYEIGATSKLWLSIYSDDESKVYLSYDDSIRCVMLEDNNIETYHQYIQDGYRHKSHFDVEHLGVDLYFASVVNDPFACYQVYSAISSWSNNNLDSLDQISRQMALCYLEKSANLNYDKAAQALDSIHDSRPQYLINRYLRYDATLSRIIYSK